MMARLANDVYGWYEIARRQDLADRRSRTLLRDWLSPAQRAEFDERGQFTVKGSHSGKLYILDSQQNYNIFDPESRTRYCLHALGAPWLGDRLLAQKIALETDEEDALRIANKIDDWLMLALYGGSRLPPLSAWSNECE